ncbi:MAG: hypothetical protein EON85_09275 [Brevundimonas sp.]|nr:MAG: hypothetical protein EON85_09275 [Brevundimonas sp.]
MFRFATLTTGMAAALMIAGFQSAPPPQLTPALAALTEDAGAARAFDYMALKAEGVDVKAMSVAANLLPMRDGGRCLTDAEQEVVEGTWAAAEATDNAAFEDDRAAAADAWARWTLFTEGLEHGQVATEEPYSNVSRRFTWAEEETIPRSQALMRRAAKDQLYRQDWSAGAQIWGQLSPGAEGRVRTRIFRAACEVDRSNTEWLKADVAANGSFTVSANGQRASSAAWLMAQHADRDREFQRHVLALMEPLVETGEVSKGNYAYLWDRIAVAEHRPQRYGSQGTCTAPGRWEPNTLEDPQRVEALREWADIGSLSDYQTHMHTVCADFEG